MTAPVLTRREVLLLFTCLFTGPARAQKPKSRFAVGQPPKTLKLNPFYEKYIDADGIPIVSSAKVPDEALVTAADVVSSMLAKRPDLVRSLVKGGARVAVMGKDELTTDIPEHSHLTPKRDWDRRARGLGGTPFIPTTSCAEAGTAVLPVRGDNRTC